MKKRLYIGIDPGLSGAVAILEGNGQIFSLLDMPLISTGSAGHTKQKINCAELAFQLSEIIEDFNLFAGVEAVTSRPGQGVASMFSFGHSLGALEGVLSSLGIGYAFVSPASWKRTFSLVGTEKDAARTTAIQMYPEAPLNRKKDSGRADAILIARYTMQKFVFPDYEDAVAQ